MLVGPTVGIANELASSFQDTIRQRRPSHTALAMAGQNTQSARGHSVTGFAASYGRTRIRLAEGYSTSRCAAFSRRAKTAEPDSVSIVATTHAPAVRWRRACCRRRGALRPEVSG